MQKRIECVVFGRVQLVMYRDFTVRSARKLAVTGTVKNEKDGTVRVVAEGEEDILNMFIAALKKGSLLSDVDHVTVGWMEPKGEFQSFTLCYEIYE